MPMPYHRNTDYSLIYAFLAVIVICLMSIASRTVIQPAFSKILGDMKLQELETSFQEIQHPTGTESLALRTLVGEFTGGDEGCDFYVGEVRSYDTSQESILVGYADQTVSDSLLQVVFIDQGIIPSQLSDLLPEPLDNLAGWEIPSGLEEQPLYMVYLYLVDNDGDMRLDCR